MNVVIFGKRSNVVSIYKEILQGDFNGCINIGTGAGQSDQNILSFINKLGIMLKTNNTNQSEIFKSIANNSILTGFSKLEKFKTVEKFPIDELSNE